MQLERFRAAKEEEIRELMRLEQTGELPMPFTGIRPGFSSALTEGCMRLPAVIAEYKRASPSRGILCEDLDAGTVAKAYQSAGARAMSVLTEEKFFQGRLSHLTYAFRALEPKARALPLLRKDFLFHPLQIRATAASPASALLLIVALTCEVLLLRSLRELAESLGLEAVVEVTNERELFLARESGASLIQVNARNLETLAVDRSLALDLIRKYPPKAHELWIQASGISCQRDLLEAKDCGYTACLVGTYLMQGGRPAEALLALTQSGQKAEGSRL